MLVGHSVLFCWSVLAEGYRPWRWIPASCRNDGLRDPRRPVGRGRGGSAWLDSWAPLWLRGTVRGTGFRHPAGMTGCEIRGGRWGGDAAAALGLCLGRFSG